ncbi:hypothetical protein QR680_000437 [Steinernema hermaphroditum]|uniref:Uncharacterized protein n=1 Tax=Steinernema hermaphroditum TaxID=289476 RepID=A0AA39LEA2_9BILA|nr:hypothetical protein QR680_000437 [Steinernema hermaphroditum]
MRFRMSNMIPYAAITDVPLSGWTPIWEHLSRYVLRTDPLGPSFDRLVNQTSVSDGIKTIIPLGEVTSHSEVAPELRLLNGRSHFVIPGRGATETTPHLAIYVHSDERLPFEERPSYSEVAPELRLLNGRSHFVIGGKGGAETTPHLAIYVHSDERLPFAEVTSYSEVAPDCDF